MPVNLAGRTESRRWVGEKTCGVPSEAAAQSWGGSASEAAAGGWSWAKKRWSSVMACGEGWLLLSLKWGKSLYSECCGLLFSRKAEEDRIRKEEEKARRELIKQEYLRKKQQQILEEQGLGKPKSKPKKPRPKSVHREESYSDSGTKCSSTRKNFGWFVLNGCGDLL